MKFRIRISKAVCAGQLSEPVLRICSWTYVSVFFAQHHHCRYYTTFAAAVACCLFSKSMPMVVAWLGLVKIAHKRHIHTTERYMSACRLKCEGDRETHTARVIVSHQQKSLKVFTIILHRPRRPNHTASIPIPIPFNYS